MKKFIIILLFTNCFLLLNAQTNTSLSLEYLKTQQDKALESDNYEAAGKYKKAILLKEEIEQAVEDEDWDTATELRKELNSLDFKSNSNKKGDAEYGDSEGLDWRSDRDFMNGGFFIDAMLGAGVLEPNSISSDPAVALGMQLGSKWYFGKGKVYRPGIQATWFRLGLQKALTNTGFSFHLYPINVGYASIVGFSDEMGLEINLNFGVGLNFLLESFPFDYGVQGGFHINPNVKFRYNELAVGFDVSSLNGPILTSGSSNWLSSNMYSITIGGKF